MTTVTVSPGLDRLTDEELAQAWSDGAVSAAPAGSIARYIAKLNELTSAIEACTARLSVTDGSSPGHMHVQEQAKHVTPSDYQRGEAAMTAETITVSEDLARAIMGDTWTDARQLGFAWECHKSAGKVTCAARGTDRGEYAAHMRGHGAKAPAPSVKPIKLRKTPPKASLPALEVNPFKWARWHQEHTEPGICECGHATPVHHAWHGNDGVTWACESCACRTGGISGSGLPKPTEYSAERRGQYLANGPAAHSVWVIPFEPAPWEDGKAEPVLLYVGKPGNYFTEAYSAKYDRR